MVSPHLRLMSRDLLTKRRTRGCHLPGEDQGVHRGSQKDAYTGVEVDLERSTFDCGSTIAFLYKSLQVRRISFPRAAHTLTIDGRSSYRPRSSYLVWLVNSSKVYIVPNLRLWSCIRISVPRTVAIVLAVSTSETQHRFCDMRMRPFGLKLRTPSTLR